MHPDFNGSRYTVDLIRANWTNAAARCRAFGNRELARITSQAEQDFVTSTFTGMPLWIGLRKQVWFTYVRPILLLTVCEVLLPCVTDKIIRTLKFPGRNISARKRFPTEIVIPTLMVEVFHRYIVSGRSICLRKSYVMQISIQNVLVTWIVPCTQISAMIASRCFIYCVKAE